MSVLRTRDSGTRKEVLDDDGQGEPGASAGAPAGRRRVKTRSWFALPAIVLVLVFFFVPFMANSLFSFLRWTSYSSVISWAGLDNFGVLVALGTLRHAVEVTVVFAIVSMFLQNLVSLSLAKALVKPGTATSIFRSLFFLPVLFSSLAGGYIWKAVLTPTGILNSVLSVFVPGDFTYNWMGHGPTALVAIAGIDAWKWSGLVTLIYIAGLKRIPAQLMEAARIDGAGPWRRYLHIEFPLLAPAFTFNVVTTLVGAFGAFDVVAATTAGGPGDATQVLNMAVFQQYGQGSFGTASALGLVITLLVVVTAVPLIAFLRSREVQM